MCKINLVIHSLKCFQGQAIGKMSHDIRMRCIEVDIVFPRNNAFQAGNLDKSKEPFSVRSKQFFPVEKSKYVSKEGLFLYLCLFLYWLIYKLTLLDSFPTI